MPLVAGVNENWDDINTYEQVQRPDSDISPIRMKTMHHLPQIFFDTLRSERPDCPVLIPNTFSVARDRLIAQDLYSYAPCGLPTSDFMPAEQAQICLMTASPVTLRALIPAPDQVTPEQAYHSDLNFYKKTLFHTPFLSRRRAITLQEYKDAKVYSRWTFGLTLYHRRSRDICCPCRAITRNGSMTLCATCRRTTLTANGVDRRQRIYSGTSCSTTCAGGPSGSAHCPAAQSPRPIRRAW